MAKTVEFEDRELELLQIALGTGMERAEQDANTSPTQDDAEVEMGLKSEFELLLNKIQLVAPAI